ncbi:MAG: hypothetical protein ACO3JL_18925, partial [Myxococcota bacterium]
GTRTTLDVAFTQKHIQTPVEPQLLHEGLRLVRVELATGASSEDFTLSMRDPALTSPIDAVRIVPPTASARPATAPTTVSALWLGPRVTRSTAGCGSTETRRLEVELTTGSGPLAGYWIHYRPASGPPQWRLLDDRNVRFFGVGAVAPCEHGVPLLPGPGELQVTPVTPSFELLGTWRFQWGEDETVLPLVTAPDGVTLPEADRNPFLAPPRDPLEELLDDDVDHAVVGLMVLLVAGAAGAAQLLYRARRRRSPHPAVVRCPACASELTLDLRAPETDGMFCPRCGGATVFVAFEPDGAPRAEVFRLPEGNRAP